MEALTGLFKVIQKASGPPSNLWGPPKCGLESISAKVFHISILPNWQEARISQGFPSGTSGKNLPANAGDVRDVGSIPGLGRSPGGGYGNLLQDSCLETPMGRGASGL